MMFFEFRMTKSKPNPCIFGIVGKHREFPNGPWFCFFDLIFSGGTIAVFVPKNCLFSPSNTHKNWLKQIEQKARPGLGAEFIWLSIGYTFNILLLCPHHAKVKIQPPGMTILLIASLKNYFSICNKFADQIRAYKFP